MIIFNWKIIFRTRSLHFHFATGNVLDCPSKKHKLLLYMFSLLLTQSKSWQWTSTSVSIVSRAFNLIGGYFTQKSTITWTAWPSVAPCSIDPRLGTVYWVYPKLHTAPHLNDKCCTNGMFYSQCHTTNIRTLGAYCNGHTLVPQVQWTLTTIPLLCTRLSWEYDIYWRGSWQLLLMYTEKIHIGRFDRQPVTFYSTPRLSDYTLYK